MEDKARTVPSDFAKCNGFIRESDSTGLRECHRRSECLRFASVSRRPERQVWIMPTLDKSGACDSFVKS